MSGPVPTLEARSAAALTAALHARARGYLPGWQAARGGPGDALLAISGALLRALAERVNAAPEKNRLAFLDLLGLELLPAQAARTPVVFDVAPAGGGGTVPAGTRLGAERPGGGQPIGFETEARVVLSAARLATVASLWPGRDEWADHSADATGGRPFAPFTSLVPVPHALYLSSARHLALAGRSVIELEVRLGRPGSAPLALAWECWDGKAWRAFGDDGEDGTDGLTRSGMIRLTSDCARSVPRAVDGIEGHWLRGRLDAPLAFDEARTLPAIDTIGVRAVVEQPLPAGTCVGGLPPDAAFADGTRLDVTKTFQPLGVQPQRGAALLFSLAAAFDRPGAAVTVCLQRPVTAAEQADAEAAEWAGHVNAAATQVAQALVQAKRVVTILSALPLGTDPIPSFANWTAFQTWLATTRTDARDVLARVKDAVARVTQESDVLVGAGYIFGVPPPAAGILLNDHNARFTGIATALVGIIRELVPTTQPVRTLADGAAQLTGGAFWTTWGALAQTIALWSPVSILDGAPPQQVGNEYDALVARITNTRGELATALTAAREVVRLLEIVDPAAVAVTQGHPRPLPPAPELAWEYWDGAAWAALPGLGGPVAARNLAASGRVKFAVPADWEPSDVAGERARWARVRLVRGVFGRIELMSWRDGETDEIKYLPIVQPRPPELDALTIGYRSAPDAEPPDRCLVEHDFEWTDRSAQARWTGGAFEPFAPVADRTPALYLGFDGPLATGTVGLFLDVEERPAAAAATLEWEYHDGDWRPLSVADGTRGLTEPGLVLVQWPGTPMPEPVAVASAAGREVTLFEPREATRFTAGQRLFLSADGEGELVTVAARSATGLTLDGKLAAEYTAATLAPPALPRFGTPRTWIRARLRTDAPPPRITVRRILHNAAPAVQVQTVRDEVLGPLTAAPGQAVFTSRTPVLPGQAIELRERAGARADVEQTLVLADVVVAGGDPSDVRLVRDARSGRVREVWVRWHERPTLLFSEPDARHYTVERTRGRIAFGDGIRGRVPPVAPDGLRVTYQTSEGAVGNVPAGAVATLLSASGAAGVANPVAAEGGADGEPERAVLARGADVLRHRRQALSLSDYEALAREASPTVALARAQHARQPGSVRLIVAPRSAEAEPRPSRELRRRVHAFVTARMPATASHDLVVEGPRYLRVGVDVAVATAAGAAGDAVVRAVAAALAAALHPLADERPFGRDLHASDVAAVVSAVDGVEQTRVLALILDGAVVGDRVSVPADRIIAAGTLNVTLAVREG
jgi:predicted phage baseplate assembly protein